MKDGIKNFKTMMQNPKTRNIYLALIGIGVVTLGVGWAFSSGNGKNNTMGGNAQVAGAPAMRAIPGSSDSPRYNEMVEENNKLKQAEALESNVPFVPTIVNSQFNAASPIDMLSMEDQKKRERKEIEDKESEERERMQKLALESLKAPEPAPVEPVIIAPPVIAPTPVATVLPPVVNQAPQKYSSNDYMLIGALTATARNYPPSSERDYFGKDAEKSNNASPVVAQAGIRQGSTQTSSAQVAQVKVAEQKAGDIIHAVLDTGINSSEPSPIMATVVSGQFKGAKLLGRFTKSGKKVVLQFNTISIPGQPSSSKLSAIAMDPNTKRSSMATDVDNHYFLRYGVLLASTFLAGYSNAIANKNTTTQITPEGSIIQTSGDKTNKDINREAIGSVGQELANQTKSQINGLEPTIYVEGGTAIGILFMEDFFLDGSSTASATKNQVGIRSTTQNPY